MRSSDQINTLLKRLSDVPGRIARATTRLSEEAKHVAVSNDEWSAAQILAHVRASDDIVAHRLYAILVRDNPVMSAYDERRWAEIAHYAKADFESSLKTYTLRRAELVKLLHQVELDDWMRSGTHEVKGTISLFDVAISLVEHEEEHCQQLETTYK